MFPTPNQSSPSGPEWGVAAGSLPTLRPPRPADSAPGPPSSGGERRLQPLRPGRAGPGAPALCRGPSSHWPLRLPGRRAPRQLQANFPARARPGFGARVPGGRQGAGGPGTDTYRLRARSGLQRPGRPAASPRSTVERQVAMHGWGEAGARPGGQTREQRGQRLRAPCGTGAVPPGQVSPPELQSPQDRPQRVELGLCLRWTLHR